MDRLKGFLAQLENESFRRKARYIVFGVLLITLLISVFSDVNVKEKKEYYDWDHVGLYIIEFNALPDNYVPKSQGVGEDDYDVTVFAVYDNTRTPVKLPVGYSYTEAYINATKDNIGKERFVFSNEQLFYTDDHYDTFEEINKFDILGTHYIFLGLFWISLSGSTIVVIISFRWEYLKLSIVVDDFKSDWYMLKEFTGKSIEYIKNKKLMNK